MVKPKNNMMNGKSVEKETLLTACNEKPFPLIQKGV